MSNRPGDWAVKCTGGDAPPTKSLLVTSHRLVLLTMSQQQAKKGKQAKRAKAVSLPVREKENAVPPDVYRYIQALVDPEGQQPGPPPLPLPQRSTSVKEVIELDLKDYYIPGAGTTGTAYVEVNPSIQNTIMLTSQASEPLDTTSGSLTIEGTVLKGVWHEPSSGDLMRKCTQVPHEIDGKQAYEIDVGGAGATLNFKFEPQASIPESLSTAYRVSYYTAGVWSVIDTTPPIPISVGHTLACAAPVGTTAFCIEVEADSGIDGKMMGTYLTGVYITCTVGTWGCPRVDELLTHVSSSLASRVNEMERWGISAMGILATYEGSDLANGGKIYAAWVPSDFALGDDPLSTIAALPVDKMDGPLKEGCHGHWVPRQLDDLEMQSPSRADAASVKFIIYAQADDISQSLRVRVTQHQRYFSNSPAYGPMNYGPCAQGLSTGLFWCVLNIPQVTENDKHWAKKAFNAIKSGGKRGLTYAINHPDEIAKYAAMLAL